MVCNWFEIWTFWYGIGSVGPNLPHHCKPNMNVWPSKPPDVRFWAIFNDTKKNSNHNVLFSESPPCLFSKRFSWTAVARGRSFKIQIRVTTTHQIIARLQLIRKSDAVRECLDISSITAFVHLAHKRANHGCLLNINRQSYRNGSSYS